MILSQTPLKGELRLRYLFTSTCINLRNCCTIILSSSLNTSVLMNLLRSNFSILPVYLEKSSSVSACIASIAMNGYCDRSVVTTKPSLKAALSIAGLSITETLLPSFCSSFIALASSTNGFGLGSEEVAGCNIF